MDWEINNNGNWIAQAIGIGLVTVFQCKDGRWKFVCDGDFSEDDYWSANAAKEVAEEIYGG